MNMPAANIEKQPFAERIEPYMAIIAPMAMIVAIFLFMAVASPTRFFRPDNLTLILQDAALYMPMAMAMTYVITLRGIDLRSVLLRYFRPSSWHFWSSNMVFRFMSVFQSP